MRQRIILLLAVFSFLGCASTDKVAETSSVSKHARRPAQAGQVDIGEQSMKPMNDTFKAVQAEITDGTKNPDVILKVNSMITNVDLALSAIPDTDQYKAEVTAVGTAEALQKYRDLLQSLRVTLHELVVKVTSKQTEVCGADCTALIQQINELKDVGHQTFKDE